ncbi:MAG: hypothetical protein ACI9WT_002021, partial [Flavobacterium sp.]
NESKQKIDVIIYPPGVLIICFIKNYKRGFF